MHGASRWAGRRRVLGVLAAVVALAPAVAHANPPAGAQPAGPAPGGGPPALQPSTPPGAAPPVQRWPGPTITYGSWLTGTDRWALRRAVRAWNRSGMAVRFRGPAALAAPAVSVGYALDAAPGLGRAQLGYAPFTTATVELRRPAERRPVHDRYVMAAVLAHELGHVLGLAHGGPCSVMAPDLAAWLGATGECRRAPPGRWRCGLLARADASAAVAMYGGAVPRSLGRRWCPR